MKCPKCNSEMYIVKHEYVQIDKCPTCNGIWFDLMEREDLLKMKGSETIDTSISEMQKNVQSKPQAKINCPKCNVKMHILRDVLQNQIEYEQCGSCRGVFLDNGEFTDLKDFSLKDFYRSLKV
jgi:Zn-finger nucleic acid-binding protein